MMALLVEQKLSLVRWVIQQFCIVIKDQAMAESKRCSGVAA